MACFVAPATVVVITQIAKKKIPPKYHVERLLYMLWGGVLMLIVDHVANKEVVPYFPFFTASWQEMWPEILRIGIPMTIIIFVVWGSMILGETLGKIKKLKRA